MKKDGIETTRWDSGQKRTYSNIFIVQMWKVEDYSHLQFISKKCAIKWQ